MKFTRFGTKLFYLFLLVSLVPLGIAGAIVYLYMHDSTKEEVLKQLRSNAHSLNIQLNLLLSKRRFRVADFSSDGFIRDCVDKISYHPLEHARILVELNNHLVVNKKSLDPEILEVEILDHTGKVIASTSQEFSTIQARSSRQPLRSKWVRTTLTKTTFEHRSFHKSKWVHILLMR